MFLAASVNQDILTYPDMATVPEPDKVWLASLVESFTDRAEAYTGREFEYRQRTQTFSPDFHDVVIHLPAFNNKEGGGTVASVHESGDQEFTSSNLVSPDDYYYESRKGRLIRRAGAWTAGPAAVQVVWTDGFKNPPADLRVACVLQVVFWYQNRSKIGSKEVRFVQGGASSVGAAWKLLDEVQEILASYGTV